jgi:hypothetical protein
MWRNGFLTGCVFFWHFASVGSVSAIEATVQEIVSKRSRVEISGSETPSVSKSEHGLCLVAIHFDYIEIINLNNQKVPIWH